MFKNIPRVQENDTSDLSDNKTDSANTEVIQKKKVSLLSLSFKLFFFTILFFLTFMITVIFWHLKSSGFK